MSQDSKREFTPQFKAQVVMETYKTECTIESISKEFNVHPTQIHKWRKEFKTNVSNIFLDKRNSKNKSITQGFKPGQSPDDLKKIIGDLTVQIEILKKVQGLLN